VCSCVYVCVLMYVRMCGYVCVCVCVSVLMIPYANNEREQENERVCVK